VDKFKNVKKEIENIPVGKNVSEMSTESKGDIEDVVGKHLKEYLDFGKIPPSETFLESEFVKNLNLSQSMKEYMIRRLNSGKIAIEDDLSGFNEEERKSMDELKKKYIEIEKSLESFSAKNKEQLIDDQLQNLAKDIIRSPKSYMDVTKSDNLLKELEQYVDQARDKMKTNLEKPKKYYVEEKPEMKDIITKIDDTIPMSNEEKELESRHRVKQLANKILVQKRKQIIEFNEEKLQERSSKKSKEVSLKYAQKEKDISPDEKDSIKKYFQITILMKMILKSI